MGARNGPGPGSPAQRGGRLAQIEADRRVSGAPQVRSGSVVAPMRPGQGVFKLPMRRPAGIDNTDWSHHQEWLDKRVPLKESMRYRRVRIHFKMEIFA